jgi:hypothetical protein
MRPKKMEPNRSKEIRVVLSNEDLDLIEELSYLDGDSPLASVLKKSLRWYGAQVKQGGLKIDAIPAKPEPKRNSANPKVTQVPEEDDPMSMLEM